MSLESVSDESDFVTADGDDELPFSSDSDNRPGSAVLIPEVERDAVDPDERRGRLRVLTLEDLGFRQEDHEMSRDERFERIRDLAMLKHTLDMTISSLQVGFEILVVSWVRY